MEQALRILTKSQQPNKVLINVTDGAWGDNSIQRNIILKRLHRMDVATMILGLNSAVSRHGKRGHLEGHDIESIDELPKAATKLVAAIMRSKAIRQA